MGVLSIRCEFLVPMGVFGFRCIWSGGNGLMWEKEFACGIADNVFM